MKGTTMNITNEDGSVSTGSAAGGIAVGAGGALAFTGLNVGWLLLLAVTLIAMGFAIWRLVPRRETID